LGCYGINGISSTEAYALVADSDPTKGAFLVKLTFTISMGSTATISVASINAYIGFADIYGGEYFNVTHAVFNSAGTQVWYSGILQKTPPMTSILSEDAAYLNSMATFEGLSLPF
jgi:hypothetical protein